MADLVLKGRLNLAGSLTLKTTEGGKVKVGSTEALVEGASGVGSPIIIPLPPAKPIDEGTRVVVSTSLNKTVSANGKSIVAGGTALQGNIPTWPGTMLPSQHNPTVMINHILISVVGDQALIAASGMLVTFTESGQ